jgi:hypothetical protein
MISLTTFATDEYAAAQIGLAQSALGAGARKVTMWRPEDLRRTQFYQENREILDRPRGGGYWLWKPYIILTELERVSEGEFVIYHDCGHPDKPNMIKRPLSIVADWCRDHHGGMIPGIYIPRYGRSARWTKGECYSVMGCDSPAYTDHPLIQAGFSVWRKQQASLDFVREWLHWCSVPAAILDDRIDPAIPDAPDFREHRHDQSVLTLLALKRGLKCPGSPWEALPGERRINCLADLITGRITAESFADQFPALAGL